MQVLIAISGFCGFCSRIGNAPCTTPFDFLFVISIHVLAWGTTTNEAARLSVVHISIHVPAWGTTALVYSEKEDVCDFNPRSREGNDKRMLLIAAASYYFNPRSREGNDTTDYSMMDIYSDFNPRSREGNDCYIYQHVRQGQYFNPRSRVGNDKNGWMITFDWFVFQSTFPRGERLFDFESCSPFSLFQSTFPRGERLDVTRYASSETNFNPRSREGNDKPERGERYVTEISIHVPARGTTVKLNKVTSYWLFQSTFPRGERRGVSHLQLN